MRLSWKPRIGRLQVSIMAGLVTKVTGVNSNLKNGQHIVMWEFDETDDLAVLASLQAAQIFYRLPNIHVAESHLGGGFHAYCFKALSFVETLHIVSGTALVDPHYITLCAMRQHWTLRLTDKGQGAPQFSQMLNGFEPETASPADLVGLVEYTAYMKGKFI